MTTLREAAQMALDALETITSKVAPMSYYCSFAVEIESLRAALAQPEQEPTRSQKMRDAGITRRPKGWDKEHELEGINEVILNSIRDSSEVVAPPQREWQGLTDEEIEIIGNKVANENLIGLVPNFRVRFARAIEQALREKNT